MIRPTSIPISPATNTRNELAQRRHNKQGRHNLRQVGLSYVLDGENGLSLCHHVYRRNVADGEEFSSSRARMLGMLDRCQIARDSVFIPQQLPCVCG